MIKLTLLLLIGLFSSADCTSPTGVAGQLTWISSAGKVKYCNGTTWKDTSHGPLATCSIGLTGAVNYSSGHLRFCDGSNWISMKGNNLGACTSTPAGVFTWDSSISKMKMCDGANWHDLSVDCTGTAWGTILEGNSVTAYSSSTATLPTLCSSLVQTRTCTDGILSGSFSSPTCTQAYRTCILPWGGSINHGDTVTAYSSSAPTGSCASIAETRTCNDGTLSGSNTSQTCTNGCVGTPWGNVANGFSSTAYSTPLPNGVSCAAVAQTRTCNNGVMSGSYTNTGCNSGCAAGDANGVYCPVNSPGTHGSSQNLSCDYGGYGCDETVQCSNGTWIRTAEACRVTN